MRTRPEELPKGTTLTEVIDMREYVREFCEFGTGLGAKSQCNVHVPAKKDQFTICDCSGERTCSSLLTTRVTCRLEHAQECVLDDALRWRPYANRLCLNEIENTAGLCLRRRAGMHPKASVDQG